MDIKEKCTRMFLEEKKDFEEENTNRFQIRRRRLKKVRRKNMIKIHNWKELSELEPVKDWNLKVNSELGGAFLDHKTDRRRSYYFSTHTFYNKENSLKAEIKLRQAGYNVRLIIYDD